MSQNVNDSDEDDADDRPLSVSSKRSKSRSREVLPEEEEALMAGAAKGGGTEERPNSGLYQDPAGKHNVTQETIASQAESRKPSTL